MPYAYEKANCFINTPGPSYSKLTISLVNDSLKFQIAVLQIHCYFLLKKCENLLHCKFVNCIKTSKANTHCKGFLHFFQQKITVCLLLKSIYSEKIEHLTTMLS